MTLTNKRLLIIVVVLAILFFVLGKCSVNTPQINDLTKKNDLLLEQLSTINKKLDDQSVKLTRDSTTIANMIQSLSSLKNVKEVYIQIDSKYEKQINDVIKLDSVKSTSLFTDWLNKLNY